jgi:hypothetical protein
VNLVPDVDRHAGVDELFLLLVVLPPSQAFVADGWGTRQQSRWAAGLVPGHHDLGVDCKVRPDGGPLVLGDHVNPERWERLNKG